MMYKTKRSITLQTILFAALLFIIASMIFIYTPLPAIVSLREDILMRIPMMQPKVVLQLEAQQNVNQGKPFSVLVKGTSQLEINGLDLYLQFDSKSLELVDIQPGSYFINPIVVSKARKLKDNAYLFSVASVTKDRKSNVFAIATFKPKVRGLQSWVILDTRTLIALKGGKRAIIKFPPRALVQIIDAPKSP